MHDHMETTHHGEAHTVGAVNHIEIVGAVLPSEQTARSSASTQIGMPRTTLHRARMTRLLLQVEEEDGAVYAIAVDVSATHAQDTAMIATLHAGDRVCVRGHLRAEQAFDRRFATLDNPDGRPTSAIVVVVHTLLAATPDAISGSWLQLTGRISVPPAIRRHEQTPDETVGRTALVVEWVMPSRRPGSQHVVGRIDRIPLDIPLYIDGSMHALRAGNRIRVEGRLEPFRRVLRPQSNRFVAQHLQELGFRWQEEQACLRGPEREHHARKQLQTVRRLQHEQRLRVRAGHIEPLEGHPMAVEDAREAHAAFVAHEKRRKQRHGAGAGADDGATTTGTG